MKGIIQMRIIPARTQSQDENFQISRPCDVRRSGQVTTFVVCTVFLLSFQAVVLLMKTVINHRVFLILSGRSEWMDLENSNGIELKGNLRSKRKLNSNERA